MCAEGGRRQRWRGLLGNDEQRIRLGVFAVLCIVSASMTFVQMGFIGIGQGRDYACYVLALLGPTCAAGMLLGKEWGAIVGAVAGAVLLLHSELMPLDFVEHYFVTPLTSIVMYGIAGFVLGWLFSPVMRRVSVRWRRFGALAVICLAVSVACTSYFSEMASNSTIESNSVEFLLAYVGTGSDLAQAAADAVLMFVVCLACERFARWRTQIRSYINMIAIFRVGLIASITLAFMVFSAAGFVLITVIEQQRALTHITDELIFIDNQLADSSAKLELFVGENNQYTVSSEGLEQLRSAFSAQGLIGDYTLDDGMVVAFDGDTVIASDCATFEIDSTVENDYSPIPLDVVHDAAKTGDMVQVLYTGDDFFTPDLGYMCARKMQGTTDGYLMMVMSFAQVFAQRYETMMWTTASIVALLVIVYVVVDFLLRKLVAKPVTNTNNSLAKIMMGNLDEVVSEVGTVEFAALSAGINSTVDSLKTLISEAERRNERDLATAKAIQEGALPRAFPAFPAIQSVNLHASMDAAKQVGGDFYDFFELDDRTVAFLIADVSGKGIPGALFMMAAKAEIQNYLLSGIGLLQSIVRANQYLCAHNEAGMFVTVWAATLDWTTGELTYVNAGHNFPLLRHGRGGSWEWLRKKCGLFLGTFETAKYRQETLQLQPGDELLLYTDGVNEAFNVAEEEYGNDRLEAFLQNHADLRPEELVRALRASVAAWAEGAEQSDDVTILAVEYKA